MTTVGTVPAGLPPIGLPDITSDQLLSDISALLPVVLAMVILILAQSAATSRAYAMKYDDSFEENTDLVGLSLANAAAGISGTFVVNGSPTKTEMVDSAGGRSQIAQLTTGAIVVVVLLFLTGPLSYMPNAVLAAVVFLIGLRLIDYRGMRDIGRLRAGEFTVAAITAATVVIVGVEQGIILAIGLSIIEHLYHSYKPYDTLLSSGPGGHMDMSDPSAGTQVAPGLAIYRFGANLYYANASRFTAEIMDIVEDASPPLRRFALSASAIGDIDYSGADTIRQVWEELGRRSITFSLCDVSPNVRMQLDAYGLTEKIGAENIYLSPQQLIAAYRTTEAARGTSSPSIATGGP